MTSTRVAQLGGPLVDGPLGIFADRARPARAEPGLLEQLAPRRVRRPPRRRRCRPAGAARRRARRCARTPSPVRRHRSTTATTPARNCMLGIVAMVPLRRADGSAAERAQALRRRRRTPGRPRPRHRTSDGPRSDRRPGRTGRRARTTARRWWSRTTFGRLRRRFHHGDGAAQVALVGECSGGDDPRLRRAPPATATSPDLTPHPIDRRPSAECPVAVGETGITSGRGAGRTPASSERTAGLNNGRGGSWRARAPRGRRPRRAPPCTMAPASRLRLLVPLAVERLGGLREPLGEPSPALLADRIGQLGRDLRIERLRRTTLRRRSGVTPDARSRRDRLVADRAVVDPRLERAVVDLLSLEIGIARRARRTAHLHLESTLARPSVSGCAWRRSSSAPAVAAARPTRPFAPPPLLGRPPPDSCRHGSDHRRLESTAVRPVRLRGPLDADRSSPTRTRRLSTLPRFGRPDLDHRA